MYKKAFWFLLFWTLLSLFLYMCGYDVFSSVMIMFVIDLIALGIIVQLGKSDSVKEAGAEISAKVDNIERVCQSILNSSGDSLMAKIEERINKQRDDVNYLLDRMSR